MKKTPKIKGKIGLSVLTRDLIIHTIMISGKRYLWEQGIFIILERVTVRNGNTNASKNRNYRIEGEPKKESFIGRFFRSMSWYKVIIILFALYSCVKIGTKLIDIQGQKKRQAELMEMQFQLEQQVRELEAKKEYIGTDEYIEEVAREKLGYAKEGEIVFKEAKN